MKYSRMTYKTMDDLPGHTMISLWVAKLRISAISLITTLATILETVLVYTKIFYLEFKNFPTSCTSLRPMKSSLIELSE